MIESLEGDDSKWKDVLDYILPRATHIEFNILHSNSQLEEFMDKYQSFIELKKHNKNKLYKSGKVLRMMLTNEVINFVKSKSFSDYRNWFLEDPSFYSEEYEVIATITHENQIYLNTKYIELERFPHFKFEHTYVNEKNKFRIFNCLFDIFK